MMLGIEINTKMGAHSIGVINNWSKNILKNCTSNICELVFQQDEDLVLTVFGKLYPVSYIERR